MYCAVEEQSKSDRTGNSTSNSSEYSVSELWASYNLTAEQCGPGYSGETCKTCMLGFYRLGNECAVCPRGAYFLVVGYALAIGACVDG